jgi:hypothetical protein
MSRQSSSRWLRSPGRPRETASTGPSTEQGTRHLPRVRSHPPVGPSTSHRLRQPRGAAARSTTSTRPNRAATPSRATLEEPRLRRHPGAARSPTRRGGTPIPAPEHGSAAARQRRRPAPAGSGCHVPGVLPSRSAARRASRPYGRQPLGSARRSHLAAQFTAGMPAERADAQVNRRRQAAASRPQHVSLTGRNAARRRASPRQRCHRHRPRGLLPGWHHLRETSRRRRPRRHVPPTTPPVPRPPRRFVVWWCCETTRKSQHE